MASPRADVRSRKDPLVSGKEVDWRGFEGSKGATEESSEIKWPGADPDQAVGAGIERDFGECQPW